MSYAVKSSITNSIVHIGTEEECAEKQNQLNVDYQTDEFYTEPKPTPTI